MVFIIAIVGVGLYVLKTRPPKDPILIVKPVEFEKSPAKAPVVEQPEQVGHVHEDGTSDAGAHEPIAAPPEVGIAVQPPTESQPLGTITFEEYKQLFVIWENAPRNKWGIPLTRFPKPPGAAGTWASPEEKEKASDLWWENVEKDAAKMREIFKRMNEEVDRQLGGR